MKALNIFLLSFCITSCTLVQSATESSIAISGTPGFLQLTRPVLFVMTNDDGSFFIEGYDALGNRDLCCQISHGHDHFFNIKYQKLVVSEWALQHAKDERHTFALKYQSNFIQTYQHILENPEHSEHQALLQYLKKKCSYSDDFLISSNEPPSSSEYKKLYMYHYPPQPVRGIPFVIASMLSSVSMLVVVERLIKLTALNARLKKTTDQGVREQLLRMRRTIKKQLLAVGAVGITGALSAFLLYKKKKKK